MIKRTRTATALLVALTLCVALAPAQLPAQQTTPSNQNPQPPTTSSQSNAAPPTVKLSFIVTDESGRVVADLKQEEVSVTENGVPQTVTYFAREELPVSYVLVMDNSGSMRTLLDTLIRVGSSFVVANKPGDETAIIRFIASDDIKLLVDFTDSRTDLGKALAQQFVGGGQTALIDAVYLAVERAAEWHEGDASRRRTVVLVSDGGERSSYFKLSQLQTLLRNSGVQVFVLGFSKIADQVGGFRDSGELRKAVKLLDTIAAESGGRVYYPEKIGDLMDAVNEIGRDMRAQYVVGYTPTNAAANGKFRAVEIKLTAAQGGATRTVIAQPGYCPTGCKEVKGEKGRKEKEKKDGKS